MKKKVVKGIRKKLIASVKETLKANNKGLICTIENDLKKATRLLFVTDTKNSAVSKKPVASEA